MMTTTPTFRLIVQHSSLFLRRGFLALSVLCVPGMVSVEVAHAGTLEGTVHYVGPDRLPKVMKVAKDQDHCGAEVSVQTIQTHDSHGALSDVVVSVEGMKKETEPKKTQRSVMNMRCAFSPRISTARQGQEIEVRNQDPILHNTHIKYGRRTFLNVAQVPNGKPIIKRIKRHGLHAIRCDKHVFMEAYLHVFLHPYYALTTEAGAFRISGIPPGKHPIRVWHESLGILEKVVNIPKKGVVRVKFTYP